MWCWFYCFVEWLYCFVEWLVLVLSCAVLLQQSLEAVREGGVRLQRHLLTAGIPHHIT